MKNISFYQPTDQSIERKRKMAEAIMKQGQQPSNTEVVTGVAVKQSPLAGLARALQQGVGGYMGGQADREEAQKTENAQKTMADALGAYSRSQAGGETALQNGEKISWNKASPDASAQMYQNILMGNPDTAPLGMQAAMGQMKSKQDAAQELDMFKQKMPFELDLARAKAQIEASNRQAPAAPAAIQIADEIRKARNAGDEQRVRDLMEVQKVVKYDPGIAPEGFTGAVAPVPGYTQAAEDIKFSQGKGTNEGQAEGDAVAKYKDFEAQLPALQQATGDLYKLADLATYNFAGKSRDAVRRETGYDVGSGAEAKQKYETIVKATVLPTLKATFGGQMSITEGQWLMDTLGNTKLSGPEKKAAIDARVQGWINQANTNAARIGAPKPEGLFENTPFQQRQDANPNDAIEAELKRRGL